MPDDEIRTPLDACLNARLVEIRTTDHDARDAASARREVFLRFDNGHTLHLWIDEVEGIELLSET